MVKNTSQAHSILSGKSGAVDFADRNLFVTVHENRSLSRRCTQISADMVLLDCDHPFQITIAVMDSHSMLIQRPLSAFICTANLQNLRKSVRFCDDCQKQNVVVKRFDRAYNISSGPLPMRYFPRRACIAHKHPQDA